LLLIPVIRVDQWQFLVFQLRRFWQSLQGRAALNRRATIRHPERAAAFAANEGPKSTQDRSPHHFSALERIPNFTICSLFCQAKSVETWAFSPV
jgi:hypothetical protein